MSLPVLLGIFPPTPGESLATLLRILPGPQPDPAPTAEGHSPQAQAGLLAGGEVGHERGVTCSHSATTGCL